MSSFLANSHSYTLYSTRDTVCTYASMFKICTAIPCCVAPLVVLSDWDHISDFPSFYSVCALYLYINTFPGFDHPRWSIIHGDND